MIIFWSTDFTPVDHIYNFDLINFHRKFILGHFQEGYCIRQGHFSVMYRRFKRSKEINAEISSLKKNDKDKVNFPGDSLIFLVFRENVLIYVTQEKFLKKSKFTLTYIKFFRLIVDNSFTHLNSFCDCDMANCNRTSSLLLFCSSCSASSLDIAKASCNCSSSSPAVVGRAHIISTEIYIF